jgi:hypothetical protein
MPVEGVRGRRRFIQAQSRVYARDAAWIQPLRVEQRQRYSSANPFFEHGRGCAWVACRDGQPVGRIYAQIDDLHLERYQDATGFFGALEALDDPHVFQALLHTAEAWLRQRGMTRVRGPFSLSINQECGLLVEGFDTPPMLMMSHGRPYYRERIEALGYMKAIDLLAYHVDPAFELPRVMQLMVDKASAGGGPQRVELRSLRRSGLKEELDILRDIFNDAWSENWGFVPFTEPEFRELGMLMRVLADDDLVQIAEVGGDPAAMCVLIPNINEAIRDLHGRLLPTGWLKLIWRLKIAYPTTARIPLMGVRKRYHKSRLGLALGFAVANAARAAAVARGIEDVEMSWILENNSTMRGMVEGSGGQVYKRYRIYEKTLL